MPQDVTVSIPKNAPVDKTMSQVRQGIADAQTRADHAKNVALSRDAADREVTFFGGGDMSGKPDSVAPDVANAYARDAARLPVRDAEDMARRTALRAGALQKIGPDTSRFSKIGSK